MKTREALKSGKEGGRQRKTPDAKLWKVFSEYIRLKYSDENGYCQCYTCGRVLNWKYDAQAGHGIGRQHMATKYDERNNRPQCKKCNGFEGGMREVYKEKMDKEYGEGTWDYLDFKSKQPCHLTELNFNEMKKYYQAEVIKLKRQKGINK